MCGNGVNETCNRRITTQLILELILPPVRFVSFGVLGHDTVPVWCDNEITVLVSKDVSPLKRLAYVARRVRLLQEFAKDGVVRLYDVPGVANPADMLTKHPKKADFIDYTSVLYNCDPSELSVDGRAASASRRQ